MAIDTHHIINKNSSPQTSILGKLFCVILYDPAALAFVISHKTKLISQYKKVPFSIHLLLYMCFINSQAVLNTK